MAAPDYSVSDELGNDDENAEPSLEEMAIDDSLPMLVRLKKYVVSNLFLHRLFVVKELTDTVEEVGFHDSVHEVIPVMADLVDDPEPLIRQTLLEQLPRIADYFVENGAAEGYEELRDMLFPFVTQLITDDVEQVRTAAQAALGQVIRHFSDQDKEVHVCPLLEKLASEDIDDEYRAEAMMIITDTAVTLGQAICRQQIVPLVQQLAQDPQFRIRKLCAICCGPLCEAVAGDLVQLEVLAMYETLCADEIWGVRKGAVESFVQIAEKVPLDVRKSRLTDIFCRLANDPSRWVRCEAFRNLARFIYTFADAEAGNGEEDAFLARRHSSEPAMDNRPAFLSVPATPENPNALLLSTQSSTTSEDFHSINNEEVYGSSLTSDSSAFEDTVSDITDALGAVRVSSAAGGRLPPSQVPERLLELYRAMAQPDSARNIDTETAFHCAYHFPAVLLTLGKARWAELSDIYHTLVNDLQWKVRRTLAYSIHEVARILGTDLTESELVPVFNSFAKDLDEVKIGIIQNFTAFLSVCLPETRMMYLQQLDEVMAFENGNNWRLRSLIALQIKELCGLFSPPIAADYLGDAAFQLAMDDVACVRDFALAALCTLIETLYTDHDTEIVDNFRDRILQQFAGNDCSVFRQTYIRLCNHLSRALPADVFQDMFMPQMLAMKADKIPNVRITLALVIVDILSLDTYRDNSELRDCLAQLKTDDDRDVVDSCLSQPQNMVEIELPQLWT